MSLTAETIYNFTGMVLMAGFDNPQPIPEFHSEMWEMCCSDRKLVAIAAPRGHAKSTSITGGYLLANLLFRERQFAVVISRTEGQSVEFLATIKQELLTNPVLHDLFGKFDFKVKDTSTDIIATAEDGFQFRLVAKGSEQEIRGFKWGHKRPDLIIGDDMESDVMVMSDERRKKFSDTFHNAVVPSLADHGIIRIVGTILHMDSLLENFLKEDSGWLSRRYKAHNKDFSIILWPEKFSEQILIDIRQIFIARGNPEGYSQEYLNYPIDEDNSYFRKQDILTYLPEEIDESRLTFYSAADFAISKKQHADYTVILTAGMDENNMMYIVDVRRGRWDSKEIIDEMFSVAARYKPDIFTAEAGMIEKSLGPFIREEMFKRNCFINLNPVTPIVDKEIRARSINARMKMGGVKFNEEADWFIDFQTELLRFPRDVHDDQVDALAWIGLTLDKITPGMTTEQQVDDHYNESFEVTYEGRCESTGY